MDKTLCIAAPARAVFMPARAGWSILHPKPAGGDREIASSSLEGWRTAGQRKSNAALVKLNPRGDDSARGVTAAALPVSNRTG